ncbi:aminoglycoside phosphotransferase family protein [Saccharothrix sp. S26]|uniref:phosphotransferase n=1 Tax=Saccharothrix sp. S26 TaxID=2907215 RepID=UPI001F436515|nr:phosphotransferase [Saccharothrix sp. S26]MCE6997762.1 aminoglycoside phosphotransferase family protein [Saccharothrix sp. S26]
MALAGHSLPRLTEATFTPERTRSVLRAACERAGLDARGAELLRHQTNAVFRLATVPVIVKVARPNIRHTAAVVSLIGWVVDHGVPTVPLLPDVPQPLEVAGCGVTFWRYLPPTRPIAADDIAVPLRALHDAPLPPFPLPELDALGAIHHSIQASTILSPPERGVLLRRWSRLVDMVPRLRYDGPPRLIHGDPQHRNTLWDDAEDRPVLCDWDSAVIGPVEWDLVTIEVHCRRFGFPEREYQSFCSRYGRDIREWDGFATVRDLRELRMVTTNARKAADGSPQADEVRRRITALEAGDEIGWTIL